MGQRPFVFEHLAEITAINPAIAGGAPDEMLGPAKTLKKILDNSIICLPNSLPRSTELVYPISWLVGTFRARRFQPYPLHQP